MRRCTVGLFAVTITLLMILFFLGLAYIIFFV